MDLRHGWGMSGKQADKLMHKVGCNEYEGRDNYVIASSSFVYSLCCSYDFIYQFMDHTCCFYKVQLYDLLIDAMRTI